MLACSTQSSGFKLPQLLFKTVLALIVHTVTEHELSKGWRWRGLIKEGCQFQRDGPQCGVPSAGGLGGSGERVSGVATGGNCRNEHEVTQASFNADPGGTMLFPSSKSRGRSVTPEPPVRISSPVRFDGVRTSVGAPCCYSKSELGSYTAQRVHGPCWRN
jgi:hypothetical protein